MYAGTPQPKGKQRQTEVWASVIKPLHVALLDRVRDSIYVNITK